MVSRGHWSTEVIGQQLVSGSVLNSWSVVSWSVVSAEQAVSGQRSTVSSQRSALGGRRSKAAIACLRLVVMPGRKQRLDLSVRRGAGLIAPKSRVGGTFVVGWSIR